MTGVCGDAVSARGGRLGEEIPGGAERPGGAARPGGTSKGFADFEETARRFEREESVESGLLGMEGDDSRKIELGSGSLGIDDADDSGMLAGVVVSFCFLVALGSAVVCARLGSEIAGVDGREVED